MSLLTLYLLLLKATITSFSGLGSLPQIRQDFVTTHAAITDEQLSHAVLIGRSTPGPMGAYVVSAGFFAAGWPGALIGWLALVTPAVAVIPLLVAVRRWLHRPWVRSAVDALVVAGAALLVPAGVQMALDALAQLRRLAG